MLIYVEPKSRAKQKTTANNKHIHTMTTTPGTTSAATTYKVGDISALFSTSTPNNSATPSSTFTEQIFGTKPQPVKPQEKLSATALKQLKSSTTTTDGTNNDNSNKRKRTATPPQKPTTAKKQKQSDKSTITTTTNVDNNSNEKQANNETSDAEQQEQQEQQEVEQKSQFRETRDLKKQKKREMDERRISKKADQSDRTLFVGNFPILDKKVKKAQKQLKKLFEPFGSIETIRVRNIAVRDAKTQNRKIALVSNSIYTKQKPFANAYVVFAVPKLPEGESEKKTVVEAVGEQKEEKAENVEKTANETEEKEEQEEEQEKQVEEAEIVTMNEEQAKVMRQQMERAVKALNATVFEGRHLCVDYVTNYDGSFTEHRQLTKRDHARSVFLGNLPFEIDDEDIWSLFEKKMGLSVERVRVVRDPETQRSRGFGFVMFSDESDALLACTKSEYFRLGENMIRITQSNPVAMKIKQAKKKKEEAKKERAAKQSFRDRNVKKPSSARALVEAEAAESSNPSNPYAGLRADKQKFLERKEKGKALKQKISKQNKMKQIRARKGLLKKW